MSTILLIILILLLLGALPAWPYSRNWGYGPSGGLGTILIIILIIVLLRGGFLADQSAAQSDSSLKRASYPGRSFFCLHARIVTGTVTASSNTRR